MYGMPFQNLVIVVPMACVSFLSAVLAIVSFLLISFSLHIVLRNFLHIDHLDSSGRSCLMPSNFDTHCLMLNRIQAMVPLTAPLFGVLFLRGHISLKNRTYCPLLRDSTSSFKGTCYRYC
jgi:hypothetical protein